MKPSPKAAAPRSNTLPADLFAALFGAFLGLALLKFGNPPIMEKWVTTPRDVYEFLLATPWPITWAYWLLAVVAVVGCLVAGSSRRSRERGDAVSSRPAGSTPPASPVRRDRQLLPLGMALLLSWLLWQFLAAADAVEPQLAKATVKHFIACVACFSLGLYALPHANRLWPFWFPLFGAFLLVLAVGWDQHYGGLKETRDYFMTYVYPKSHDLPAEYLQKVRGNRIFSTLFYPNALAGTLLLLLPVILTGVSRLPDDLVSKHLRLTAFGTAALAAFCAYRFGMGGAAVLLLLSGVAVLLPAWRRWLAGLMGIGALGCLYWSGSKGGWLLMLLLGLIALLRLPFGKRFKLALVTAVLLLGLAGFFWKYAGFFQKGATSVAARFDYWRAALQTAKAHPLLGTGPGTFAIPYQQIKRPDAEMSRMVHNDYLEQASDSGLIGFLAYTSFIVAALALAFPKTRSSENAPKKATSTAGPDWLTFSVWLGVLGWSLQSLFEFGLYIPALAWPAFALLGWLLGREQV